MSLYWGILPTFRPARRVYRDVYGPMGAPRLFRDQPQSGGFNFWPWDLDDSIGMRVQRDDRDARKADVSTDRSDQSAGAMGQVSPSGKTATGTLQESPADQKDFRVALDLTGFAPEEISVKIVGDRTLRVEARHDQQTEGGGHVLWSYRREFNLPVNVDLDALKSRLDAEGVLSVTAPVRGLSERQVPIEFKSSKTSEGNEVKTSHAEDSSINEEKPEDKK